MIKFRGLTADTEMGRWAYGSFLYRKGGTNKTSHIISAAFLIYDGETSIEIKPNTLGQYADLTDKDSKPLDWWQGDIIRIEGAEKREIVLKDGCFWAQLIGRPGRIPLYSIRDDRVTVIGNRYENLELLKGR